MLFKVCCHGNTATLSAHPFSVVAGPLFFTLCTTP